jgi:hypothetical protein
MASSGRRVDIDVDKLPAYGLREDEFDDRLRRYGSSRYALDDENEEDDEDVRFPPDPDAWVIRNRVSQTEVGLHLGRFLLRSPIVDSNVVVTLAGHELTRRERPQFPVARYLTEKLGFDPRVNRVNVWRGHYSLRGATRKLVVTYDRLDGHVSARLTSGARLIVFVSGGRMHSARGSAEHRALYAAIGRAVTWTAARPTDRLAICVPRSAEFRKAIANFRKADGVRRLGILMLTVDRNTSDVGGLVDLESGMRH